MPVQLDQITHQDMPVWVGWVGWVPAILFWGLWACCILHWYRKKAFYPVFWHPTATKAFWGVSFLLISPLVTLMYLVFSVAMPPDRKPVWWRSLMIVVPVALVVLSMALDFQSVFRRTTVSLRDPATGILPTPGEAGLSMHLGVQRKQVSTNSGISTSYGGSDHSRLTLSSVWIQEMDAHPLVRNTAQALHQRLAGYSPIVQIGWGAPGSAPPSGEQSYDFFIFLSLPSIENTHFPGYRRIEGTLLVEIGTTPFAGNHSYYESSSPPIITVDGSIQSRFQSAHTGLESPRARFTRTGSELADDLFAQLEKTFGEIIDKHGLAAGLPDFMYGPMTDTPELPFPEHATIDNYMSTYGLLNHNHSIWKLESDAAPGDFLEEIHRAMQDRGWSGELEEATGGSYLRMTHKEDVFWIGREVTYPEDTGVQGEMRQFTGEPYYAHYEDRFSEEEFTDCLENLLASNPGLETLLAFRSHFQRYGLRKAYYQYFEENRFEGREAALIMAQHYLDQELPEQAGNAVRKAEILSWFETDPKPQEGEVKKILDALHLDALDNQEPDEAVLRGLGVAFPEEEGFPVIREMAVGEPVIVRWKGTPGLWGVHVRPIESKDDWQYVVMQTGNERTWRSSNFSVTPQRDVLTQWNDSIDMSGDRRSVAIKVEQIERGRLRYTIDRVDWKED